MFIPLEDWGQVMQRLTVEAITEQPTLPPILAVPMELQVQALTLMQQENIKLRMFEQDKQWTADTDKKRLVMSLKQPRE